MISFKNRIVNNLEIEGVYISDYPDFCDAYFFLHQNFFYLQLNQDSSLEHHLKN